ncbi:MAG TPA: alpha-amylase family glycosyl hydrolase [Bacteroidales bacterium]|nr:alpha-amylase family glycosyl hydrolase [Bacteroidales bacterium]
MIKYKLFFTGLLIFTLSVSLRSQVLTWEPEFPTIYDTVTIYYDAGLGNGALLDVDSVFAHTGVITSLSINNNDWEHKVAAWGEKDSILYMENLGNNIHKFRFYPKNFYAIHQSETVTDMCFVFRNADGTLAGKNADGSDFVIPLWTATLQARFIAPVKFPMITNQAENFQVTVLAKSIGMINVFHDGNLISQSYSDEHTLNIVSGSLGKHWIKFVYQSGNYTVTDSLFYLVQEDVVVEALPVGIIDGINIIDENNVIFCLHAPWKNRVYMIGDFNDWAIEPEYQCKRTPDGQRWWYRLENLDPETEYRFQYLVDFDINIADPYSQKLLDHYNDVEIHQVIYPNLIAYPTGKASEMVGVFKTSQDEYQWQVTDFEKPDNRDLVIYEMLVRDWHTWHSYKTVMDSIQYLADLGINAIELMPVNEYDGNDSWGYMPAFFFAPDKCYGTSDMLKGFIDACHQNGIAVILDVVLNHASGQNPMARLYYNKERNRPTWQNPWFNELIPHPYGYHNDFNHESALTQQFVDSVLSYWVNEYHVDGYRLDLSKGFTNNVTVGYDENGDINWTDVGAWGNYDVVRVDNLKAMGTRLWNKHPGTYIILEHLASFWEEKALSDHGFMLWCGMSANEQYAQAGMGWTDNADFKWGVSYQHYQGNNLGQHNLVGYMESHDEERLMYKCLTYGNMAVVEGDTVYSTRDLKTALKRMELIAAFFFTVPGPKMMWQFGERGFDYSINWPAVDQPGVTRTDKKPPRWDYMGVYERIYLYKVYSALINLRKSYNIFRTSNYEMSTSAYDKRIRLWDDGYVNAEMQVVVLGNFNVESQSVWPEFSHDGYWYDYFTGDSIFIDSYQTENQNFSFDFLPGEYHIYTDMRLDTPDLYIDTTSNNDLIPGIIGDVYNTCVFPNPVDNNVNVEFSSTKSGEYYFKLYNISGQVIIEEKLYVNQGRNKLVYDISKFKSGVYFYRLSSDKTWVSGKILKN